VARQTDRVISEPAHPQAIRRHSPGRGGGEGPSESRVLPGNILWAGWNTTVCGLPTQSVLQPVRLRRTPIPRREWLAVGSGGRSRYSHSPHADDRLTTVRCVSYPRPASRGDSQPLCVFILGWEGRAAAIRFGPRRAPSPVSILLFLASLLVLLLRGQPLRLILVKRLSIFKQRGRLVLDLGPSMDPCNSSYGRFHQGPGLTMWVMSRG